MANINKIRLSGTTYNIQDLNATKTVELTQAEYDALSPKDPNVFYIITDAKGADLSNYYTKTETDGLLDTKLDVTAYTPTDLSNYYTKSETSGATEISTALSSKADTATTYTKTETDNAITAATSTKQDTLVSGTNIKTINSQSILGEGNITIEGGSGGGKAVSGGTNISITTGETADTINCTLPITVSKNGNQNEITFENVAKFSVIGYAGGVYAVAIGDQTVSNGAYAIAIGYGARTNYKQSFSYGYYSITNNEREFSTGSYNNSVSESTTFGDSGNTLFSVGNGTAYNARHNAFEIRQNGDIYISKDGQDVKLQDQLGGGGSITIDPSLDASSTNPVANSAITNAINNRATKGEAYGNMIFGSSSGKEYVQFQKVSGTRDNARYISKINGYEVWGTTNINACKNWELVETSAITTTITSSSSDSQVPSAKAVYDMVGNINTILESI